MKIDHIYVINLRSSIEGIIDRLNGLNLPQPTDYTILDGVNGRNLVSGSSQPNVSYDWKVADWWKLEGHSNSWWARDINSSEVGCTLSHYNCWLDAKKNAYESVLILEEDFVCKENQWPNDLDLLPSDWDFMYMGRMKNNQTIDTPYKNSIVKPGYSYNTHAYLISASGIEKAINTNPNLDIIPADELIVGFMGNHPREDVNKRFNVNLNMFAFSEVVADRGFLLEPTETDEQFLRMIKVLHNSPELKAKLRHKAHQWAKQQTWFNRAMQWHQMIQQLRT